MEVLLIAIAGTFYLFAGYSAAAFGFGLALFVARARPRLGFAPYWIALGVAASLALSFFGWAQWVPHLAGFALGRAYAPSYGDGAERTGARSSRWFRRLRAWRVLHWWTDFWATPGLYSVSGMLPGCSTTRHALYAVHPHGFLPVSAALGFALPGCGGPIVEDGSVLDPLIATTDLLFWIPGVREVALWSGCVVADEEVMVRALADRSLVVAPGGVSEGIRHDHDKLRLSFEHWGFLRVAERAGAVVIPVFASGENRVWVALPGCRSIKRYFNKRLRYPFPMLFVPFLFPHELRLTFDPRSTMTDPRDVASRREAFAAAILALVREHEDEADWETPDLMREREL